MSKRDLFDLDLRVEAEPPRRRSKPDRSAITDAELASVRVVMGKLAARTGVKYRGRPTHVWRIVDRLREGYSELELRAVIGYCAYEMGWLENETMRPFLRPETLFGPETIERYADAAMSWYESLGEAKTPVTARKLQAVKLADVLSMTGTDDE